MRTSSLLAFACIAGLAAGHGILKEPAARLGQANGNGIKLQPFTAAETVANALDCGGVAGGAPSPGPVVKTYTQGSQIKVEWDITIPHTVDNTNTGIRIAVHYSNTDSFAQNILAGPKQNVLAGPGEANAGLGSISAQSGNQKINSLLVRLPPDKVSETAIVQWMWAAQNDGGFYLGCSDVKIVTGTPADVTPTPPPTPSPTPPPGVTDAPTPAPEGIPTIKVEFEIREGPGSQLNDWSQDSSNIATFNNLKESFAQFFGTKSAQITINPEVAPKEGNLEAGVRVTLTVNYDGDNKSVEARKAKDAINKTNEESLAKEVFNESPGFENAKPKITDWTMCNTGETDGCTSSVKAESSTPVATIALIALAVPIVAVGIIIGLGGKKGRRLLLNGERS